jgi:hypothetical protein
MTEKDRERLRLIEGGLILLSGAIAADDPKKELNLRVRDLIAGVRILSGRST